MKTTQYQPKTGTPCHCKPGQQRDNCPTCEGTGQRIDFAVIRNRALQNTVPAVVRYEYQPATLAAARHLRDIAPGTIAEQSHMLGMSHAEPLIIAMDALIRYATAAAARYGDKLATDYVLGPPWLSAARSIRALCDGDGGAALEQDITTDSKDNGTVEAMFWQAMEIAGFTEADLV